MSIPDPAVYLATVALEKNRWAPGKQPSFRVSDWIDRARDAGFDGLELWENHAACVDDAELDRIAASGFPVAVFNTYAAFEDEGEASRRRAALLGERLGAGGYKFNLGHDPARRAEYLRCASSWRESLPASSRVLCECHPGTFVETPGVAREVLDELGSPDRFGAIVHPFYLAPTALRDWLLRLGPERIRHAHVQLRDSDQALIRLDRDAGRVLQALEILQDAGYRGSYTIEFTEGTRSPDESVDLLFRNAVADLRFLKSALKKGDRP